MRGFLVAVLSACGFSQQLGGPAAGDDVPGDARVVEWAKKRKLTIDNPYPTTFTKFGLALHLDATRINYSATKTGGADVRIGDASGNFYPYEIEQWNPAGTSIIWVGVPTITASTQTDIWLYYGNPNATDAQNAEAVWDTDYVGVWHLGDERDSTGRLASTNSGGTPMPGRIGNAMSFGGGNQHVDTKSTEHLTRWTVELWLNPTNAGNTANGSAPPLSRFPNYTVLWGCNTATFCKTVMFNSDAAQTQTFFVNFDAGVGTWTHIAGRYDGATIRSFINGLQSMQANSTATPQNTANSTKIGDHADLSGNYIGLVDEVRISRTARSLDFIGAHAKSTADALVTYGPEEAN